MYAYFVYVCVMRTFVEGEAYLQHVYNITVQISFYSWPKKSASVSQHK